MTNLRMMAPCRRLGAHAQMSNSDLCLAKIPSGRKTARPEPILCAKLPRMRLIVILIVLVLLFGGGGYYMGPGVGYYGGGGVSLILLIVILFLFFGRGRSNL
jgi:hypothetical protein